MPLRFLSIASTAIVTSPPSTSSWSRDGKLNCVSRLVHGDWHGFSRTTPRLRPPKRIARRRRRMVAYPSGIWCRIRVVRNSPTTRSPRKVRRRNLICKHYPTSLIGSLPKEARQPVDLSRLVAFPARLYFLLGLGETRYQSIIAPPTQCRGAMVFRRSARLQPPTVPSHPFKPPSIRTITHCSLRFWCGQ